MRQAHPQSPYLKGPPAVAPIRAALAMVLVLVPALPGRPIQAQVSNGDRGCEVCHGELELLRQHSPSLEEAMALMADRGTLAASAHSAFTCSDCHTGYSSYPHPAGGESRSRSCASCHEEQETEWVSGVHAEVMDESTGATCSDCHGTHDVATLEALTNDPGQIELLNTRCQACHESSRLPEWDPHAESTPCSGCHGSHAIHQVDDPTSSVTLRSQGETCGACHEEAAPGWLEGAHGQAALGHVPHDAEESQPVEEHGDHREPPGCTGCHSAHGTNPVESDEFALGISAVCEGCHHEYAHSYLDSYHGQATSLGSRAAATCTSCHGAHGVFPASDPRSAVHEGNLLETCRTCHPNAGPSFAGFAPHADHNDRERFPQVYWSFRFMTALLIGVFAVFGLHTALWLNRLVIGEPKRSQGKGEEDQ
jgi:hypothetical protein